MSNVLMYGAEWCGDCRRSKRFLDSNNVEYTYIDVEADKSAADKVVEINGGAQSIPVIVFSDGTHLTEPSDNDLKAKLTSLNILQKYLQARADVIAAPTTTTGNGAFAINSAIAAAIPKARLSITN